MDTARWTLRSWIHGDPVPRDVAQWACTLPWERTEEDRERQRIETWTKWQFLSPFFASQGLYLYEYFPEMGKGAACPPAWPASVHTSAMPMPWARKAYEKDDDIDFSFLSVRLHSIHPILA